MILNEHQKKLVNEFYDLLETLVFAAMDFGDDCRDSDKLTIALNQATDALTTFVQERIEKETK